MGIPSSLNRFHKNMTASPWLRLFTAVTRGWLAIGFILPGLKKVVNLPFAPGIPVTGPIGGFFDAFFQATEYYIFVGTVQVVAGFLLLFPATVTLGSILYFPVILNIFVITVALEFKGTWVIAGLMLLANTFLLYWDFDRWRAVLPGFVASQQSSKDRHLGFWPTVLAGGLSGLFVLGALFVGLGVLNEKSIAIPLATSLAALCVSAFLMRKYRMIYKNV